MFFTLEDPRAKVQGSRDPLGVQPIWSRFGREVVCNLTTSSRSVRGFAVLLLGRYLAEELIDEGKAPEEDATDLFLKFEQIAAYSRQVSTDGESDDIILGVNRVKKKLAEGNRKVKISERQRDQILSDQKAYGLWGLYSVPARVSGLLKPGPVGLTQVGRQFVEDEYVPRLNAQKRELKKLICNGGNLVAKKQNQPCKSVVTTLSDDLTIGERSFFRQTLQDATEADNERQPAAQRQAELSLLIKKIMEPGDGIHYSVVDSLRSEARRAGMLGLEDRLKKIMKLESAIAPAQHVFDYVMAHDGSPLTSVAQAINDLWGRELPLVNRDLSSILPMVQSAGGQDFASHLQQANKALTDGDYVEAISAVVQWNESVMQSRGSSGWVGSRNGKIVVKLRNQNPNLPDPEEPRFGWTNSYFMTSLRDVTFQLKDSNG